MRWTIALNPLTSSPGSEPRRNRFACIATTTPRARLARASANVRSSQARSAARRRSNSASRCARCCGRLGAVEPGVEVVVAADDVEGREHRPRPASTARSRRTPGSAGRATAAGRPSRAAAREPATAVGRRSAQAAQALGREVRAELRARAVGPVVVARREDERIVERSVEGAAAEVELVRAGLAALDVAEVHHGPHGAVRVDGGDEAGERVGLRVVVGRIADDRQRRRLAAERTVAVAVAERRRGRARGHGERGHDRGAQQAQSSHRPCGTG